MRVFIAPLVLAVLVIVEPANAVTASCLLTAGVYTFTFTAPTPSVLTLTDLANVSPTQA